MRSSRGYLLKRANELATPATRALNDPLAAWAETKIRLDGRPFSFEGHEYLRAIYDDTSPHVVLSKAAQVGGTTYGILRAFHACLQGLNVIYFFPTRTDVLDFSRSRVGPLLADNPFLSRHLTDTDTVGLKRIGDAFLYFRGMRSAVGMKSVPADMVVFDELDEATPDSRALALERLAHSDYGRILELSNPSLPGYGIDEQYETSDQRHWYLKCPGCGELTCLERDFPVQLNGDLARNFAMRDVGTAYPACPECREELDLDRGEWIPDFPDRPIHGYRVSQLYSSKANLWDLLQEYLDTRHPERFYNLKIGIPWADLEKRVDVGAVMACVGDAKLQTDRDHEHYVGIDTGKELHVVVLQRRSYDHSQLALVQLAKVREFEDLGPILERLNVRFCVIDGLPETHRTRDFAREHRFNNVFLCFFNVNQRGAAKWYAWSRRVEVNRTEALDQSRQLIRDRKIVVARGIEHLQEFAQHMSCDAKKIEEDEDTGERKAKYVRTGADHFSMAFTYASMALFRRGRDWVKA